MRKTVLAIAAAALLGGAGAASLPLVASAQSASPPAPTTPGPAMPAPMSGGPGEPMMQGPIMGGRMMEGPMMRGPGPEMGEMHGRHEFMEHMMRTWGLFDRPADLALSPADVTTIAEAILLRNGQHDWKVGEVTPNADHTVSFAYLTAHGDVVARFSMDTRTGRIERTD